LGEAISQPMLPALIVLDLWPKIMILKREKGKDDRFYLLTFNLKIR